MESNEELLMNPELRMKSLMKKAAGPEVISSIPIQRYYRSLNEVHRTATCCLQDKEREKALMFYTRFISLALEDLPKHADYKGFVSSEKTKVDALLQRSLTVAEQLKKSLMVEFENDAKNARIVAESRAARLAAQDKVAVDKKPSVIPSQPGDYIINPDISTDHLEFGRIIVPAAPSTTRVPVAPPTVRMVVAADLVEKFIRVAAANTARNVETCAILAGPPVSGNVSRITHAVVPKQTGGSESCNMLDEEDLWSCMDAHSIIQLGWIHTHPTQTAFLSSVDLHTQFAYQSLSHDSLAIVAAPAYEQVGVYRLSEKGMRDLSKCCEKGFHPHDNASSMYYYCHDVAFESAFQAVVVDLR